MKVTRLPPIGLGQSDDCTHTNFYFFVVGQASQNRREKGVQQGQLLPPGTCIDYRCNHATIDGCFPVSASWLASANTPQLSLKYIYNGWLHFSPFAARSRVKRDDRFQGTAARLAKSANAQRRGGSARTWENKMTRNERWDLEINITQK